MKISDLFDSEEWTPESVSRWIRDRWNSESAEIDFCPNRDDIEVDGCTVSFGHRSTHLCLDLDYGELPFKIDKFGSGGGGGTLDLYHPKTLHGCPKKVGILEVANVRPDFTLAGCPQYVGTAYLDVRSCRNINKYIKHATNVRITGSVESNILGLLLVDGLSSIRVDSRWDDDATFKPDGPLKSAVKILNKHVGKGRQGVVSAQREMLEYDVDDLEAFAEV